MNFLSGRPNERLPSPSSEVRLKRGLDCSSPLSKRDGRLLLFPYDFFAADVGLEVVLRLRDEPDESDLGIGLF